MIILDRNANNAERMLVPTLDSNNLLRISTASANLPQDQIEWFRFTDSTSTPTIMGNASGRFYFQPSATGCLPYNRADQGQSIETLASVHYSPHKDYLPTLATDSSGNYFYTNGEYDSDLSLFCPYNNRSNSAKLPLHDIELTGYAASITHESGGGYSNVWSRVYRNNTRSFHYLRWHAWCLGILTTTGATDITKFVMNVPITESSIVKAEQDVKIDLMIPSGNSVYVLIKSDINEYQSYRPTPGNNTVWPSHFDQPQLKIELSANSSFQVTSFGFDITPSPVSVYNSVNPWH